LGAADGVGAAAGEFALPEVSEPLVEPAVDDDPEVSVLAASLLSLPPQADSTRPELSRSTATPRVARAGV
jgi:hypothetical protein